MIKQKNRKEIAAKRHNRIRVKISGTSERPRLSVYRSNKHIYAQIIDDIKGVTLASAGTTETTLKDQSSHGGDVESAKKVGQLIAERAKKAGVESVVFDRGGFLYHGRIAALADAAREGGLVF
ncbi:MAG: 50S ribosomal protein L18 [Candidatus Melainabacteria bacterium RIFOXYA12_FULL_32_12]|nr:MAG: 50S ribosomal protein L18 [Candidatus Melainabacteria bacterium GWF2_32_7]OGI22667.1 MAG: 50S ribosomal protein L18 [Candidatus Melainabacteria bacterium RIFOXYA2_FULL_32_9]OGI31772.1 MAG: 50S ribosomal protein L18 [Candidatus Melainabacteria bacterium RIFOXYA12_FULL_32_12]